MHKIIHSYKELTPRELNESKKIYKAFNKQYWKKLKQSTISPLIRKEDYLEVFNNVCEILSRIRSALQINFTLTGNASNYLLQLVDIEPANENFMRTIVHEALKDSKGYISKLDKVNVDKFIDDHLSYIKNRNEKRIAERREKVNKVKETWENTIKNMKEILEKTNMQESYSDLFIEDNKTHEPFILEIADRLESLNDSLEKFSSFQEKRKQKIENRLNREIKNHKPTKEQESKPKEESTKEDVKTNENVSQENQSQEETLNQNEIDEKVMISVQKVEESVEGIQEKLHNLQKNTDLHHLEEISELPFEQKKEKVKYLRKNTLALAEKLSEHLFILDQLVGSSEKVRPYKKKQVNEIQSILGQVDKIGENLKKLESDLKHQEDQLKEKEEKEREERETKEREVRERKEREEREMMEKLEKNEREQFQKDFEERMQREREERENYLHQKYHNQKNYPYVQKGGQVNQKGESGIEDILKDFPLPSKDQWRQFQYEAEFEVKKYSDKYNLKSYIPNLDTEELKILEKDNVLTISGVRYPTEQEEKALVQKLLNYLKYYRSSIDDWGKSDYVRAVLKVGSGSFGSFKISYSLPDDYDNKSEISASYLRGVLEINVPTFQHQHKKFVHPFFSDSIGYDNFWSK